MDRYGSSSSTLYDTSEYDTSQYDVPTTTPYDIGSRYGDVSTSSYSTTTSYAPMNETITTSSMTSAPVAPVPVYTEPVLSTPVVISSTKSTSGKSWAMVVLCIIIVIIVIIILWKWVFGGSLFGGCCDNDSNKKNKCHDKKKKDECGKEKNCCSDSKHKGEKGDCGAEGKCGHTGPKGDTGARGAPGDQGDIGPNDTKYIFITVNTPSLALPSVFQHEFKQYFIVNNTSNNLTLIPNGSDRIFVEGKTLASYTLLAGRSIRLVNDQQNLWYTEQQTILQDYYEAHLSSNFTTIATSNFNLPVTFNAIDSPGSYTPISGGVTVTYKGIYDIVFTGSATGLAPAIQHVWFGVFANGAYHEVESFKDNFGDAREQIVLSKLLNAGDIIIWNLRSDGLGTDTVTLNAARATINLVARVP